MKKIKVIVKPRLATWMKDTTETFTMTDKVYDNSTKKLKEVESKCTTNEFVTIESIVEYLAKLAYDLELPKKGKYIANKLGLSDSEESVIAMAKHYQDITIR